MTNLPIVFTFLGLFLSALSLPLALRWIPPNRVYGLRVKATLTDKTVWYDANARSGRDLALVGIVLAVTGLALSPLAVSRPATYALSCTAVLVVGGAVATLAGTARADRMLRERSGGSDESVFRGET